MATRVFASISGSLKECETIPMDDESYRRVLRYNLNVIFPNLIVMEHGYHAGSVVFSTLAYDTNRGYFVVVEYGRGESGLADRMAGYAGELEKTPHQTHLLALCKTRLGSRSPERWPGAYVVVLTDHPSDHDKDMAMRAMLGMPVELHLVQRPNLNTVAIKSINVAQMDGPKTSGAVSKPLRRRGRPAKGTMGFLLRRRKNHIKDIGFALETALGKLQLKPHVPKSSQYARFKHGAITVCSVSITRDGLRLYYPVKGKADTSGFVYDIKHQLGGYASDINTLEDIRLALSEVQAVYRSLTASKNLRGSNKTPGNIGVPNPGGGAPTIHDAKFTFYINGQMFKANSAAGALKKIFEYLPQIDRRFLVKFDKLEYSGKRRYVARDSKLLCSPGSAHPERRAYAIQSAPGWWLGTNYTVESIKRIASMARNTVRPAIRDTMSGDIFDYKLVSKARPQKSVTGSRKQKHSTPAKSDVSFMFSINGKSFVDSSAIGALKQIFDYLPQVDDQFLENFDAVKHGDKRRYVARDKDRLYPSGFANVDKYVFAIPSAPGWWMGTNYNVLTIKRIASLARETVKPEIRSTMTGDIFDAGRNAPKPRALSTKASVSDGPGTDLVIPESENTTNEFKSSFRYDYRAAQHEKDGERRLAEEQRDMVRKNNYGHGLEWDVAKTIAGFSNSRIGKGRIWIGVGEVKGSKPKVLGLENDMIKSKSKSVEDDFGNWIVDLLKTCIRDYTSFDNIQISYQRIDGKQICVLDVAMGTKPMYLFEKNDPNNTMFYKRDSVTARTNHLMGAALADYIRDRF